MTVNKERKTKRLTELNNKLQPVKPNEKQYLSRDEAIVLCLRSGVDNGRYQAVREGVRF